MLETIASDVVIDEAYEWLCHRRRHWPATSDVWSLRFDWARIKPALQQRLRLGDYRFDPMSRVTKGNGETIHIWSARDALAIVLAHVLPVSPLCTHVKGHGGAKAAVRAVRDQLPDHGFVMRTDVKSYYDSIDHHRMLGLLEAHIKDREILNLLWQVMRRTVTWGGLYKDCKQGISRGCPLSPLLGAFFLHELDSAMETSGLFYVRFMDDILVLAPTRHKLRAGVRTVNQHFERLGLRQHPDKTFIGRIEKGFDFLGYHFSRAGMTVALATVERLVARIARLYEQGADEERIGEYKRRWWQWLHAGGLIMCFKTPSRRLDLENDWASVLRGLSATYEAKGSS